MADIKELRAEAKSLRGKIADGKKELRGLRFKSHKVREIALTARLSVLSTKWKRSVLKAESKVSNLRRASKDFEANMEERTKLSISIHELDEREKGDIFCPTCGTDLTNIPHEKEKALNSIRIQRGRVLEALDDLECYLSDPSEELHDAEVALKVAMDCSPVGEEEAMKYELSALKKCITSDNVCAKIINKEIAGHKVALLALKELIKANKVKKK